MILILELGNILQINYKYVHLTASYNLPLQMQLYQSLMDLSKVTVYLSQHKQLYLQQNITEHTEMVEQTLNVFEASTDAKMTLAISKYANDKRFGNDFDKAL